MPGGTAEVSGEVAGRFALLIGQGPRAHAGATNSTTNATAINERIRRFLRHPSSPCPAITVPASGFMGNPPYRLVCPKSRALVSRKEHSPLETCFHWNQLFRCRGNSACLLKSWVLLIGKLFSFAAS